MHLEEIEDWEEVQKYRRKHEEIVEKLQIISNNSQCFTQPFLSQKNFVLEL